MNKNSKKVIITAGLSMGMCLSLISGATYALFTSESVNNITVQSGKVSVLSSIDEASMKAYSLENGVQTQQTTVKFNNGGTISLLDNQLSLVNITPGDKLTFNIKVNNESTVTSQYRVKSSIIVEENGQPVQDLSKGDLVVKHGHKNWQKLEANSLTPIEVPVSIELPEEATLQGYSYKVSFTVEAVQGNADVKDDLVLNTNDNIADVLNSAQPNSTIKLSEGNYVVNETIQIKDDLIIDATENVNLVDNLGQPAKIELSKSNPDAKLTVKGMDPQKLIVNEDAVFLKTQETKQTQSQLQKLASSEMIDVYEISKASSFEKLFVGDYTLEGDIIARYRRLGTSYRGKLQPIINIKNDVNINLNGHTIRFEDQAIDDVSGVPVFFSVVGAATVNINGEGKIDTLLGGNSAYGLNIFNKDAVVNVNGGTYLGSPTVFQVQEGTLNVAGGHFELEPLNKQSNPEQSIYLINCIDANWKVGSASINVTGGTFVGLDPSSKVESVVHPTLNRDNYLAEGYEVKKEVQGKDTIYTVSKSAKSIQ